MIREGKVTYAVYLQSQRMDLHSRSIDSNTHNCTFYLQAGQVERYVVAGTDCGNYLVCGICISSVNQKLFLGKVLVPCSK